MSSYLAPMQSNRQAPETALSRSVPNDSLLEKPNIELDSNGYVSPAYLAEMLHTPIVDWLPILKRLETSVVELKLPTRAERALLRSKLFRVADVVECTPHKIMMEPNTGEISVRAILGALIRHADGRLTLPELPLAPVQSENTRWHLLGEHESALIQTGAMRDLLVLLRWGSIFAPEERLLEVLMRSPDDLPEDAANALERLKNLSSARFEVELSESLVDRLFEELEPRHARIFQARHLDDEQRTLSELGQEFDLTRERVRQLGVIADQRFGELLELETNEVLRWAVDFVRRRLGSAAIIGHPVTLATIDFALKVIGGGSYAERLLLFAAGPYLRSGSMFVTADAPQPGYIVSLMPADGWLPLETVRRLLVEQGVAESFVDGWLEEHCAYLRVLDNHVLRWTGTLTDKCFVLLALKGAPVTAEELLDMLGESSSLRSVRQRIQEDDRFSRVDKSRYGLRAWALEEYTGIADEIAQRIGEAGGQIRLDSVVTMIAEQFSVSASSVRVYAQAPMFVVDGQFIRLRTDEERMVLNDRIQDVSGAFILKPDVVSFLVDVDKELLRGSGRTLVEPIGAFLGLRPDLRLTFDIDGIPLTLTWPKSSAFGPSIGSLRAHAKAAGAELGDKIRLEFDRSQMTGAVSRIETSLLETAQPCDALTMLTGAKGDVDIAARGLAEQLKVSTGDFRALLYRRGDERIADLLQPAPISEGLREAAARLAEVLAPKTE